MTLSTQSKTLIRLYLINLECFPRVNIAENDYDYSYLAVIYSETKV